MPWSSARETQIHAPCIVLHVRPSCSDLLPSYSNGKCIFTSVRPDPIVSVDLVWTNNGPWLCGRDRFLDAWRRANSHNKADSCNGIARCFFYVLAMGSSRVCNDKTRVAWFTSIDIDVIWQDRAVVVNPFATWACFTMNWSCGIDLRPTFTNATRHLVVQFVVTTNGTFLANQPGTSVELARRTIKAARLTNNNLNEPTGAIFTVDLVIIKIN